MGSHRGGQWNFRFGLGRVREIRHFWSYCERKQPHSSAGIGPCHGVLVVVRTTYVVCRSWVLWYLGRGTQPTRDTEGGEPMGGVGRSSIITKSSGHQGGKGGGGGAPPWGRMKKKKQKKLAMVHKAVHNMFIWQAQTWMPHVAQSSPPARIETKKERGNPPTTAEWHHNKNPPASQ